MTGVTFILALCQWGKFTRGKNCFIENAIQNKHWAGKAGEAWKHKSEYAFFIFDLKCYFRSTDFTMQCKSLNQTM